jgi:hypothetical protein
MRPLSTGTGVSSAKRWSDANTSLHSRSCNASSHQQAPPTQRRAWIVPIRPRGYFASADRAACDRNICSPARARTAPAIARSGAAVWLTVPQLRQAYLGRRIRTTRNWAGTQSSISLTISPMLCKAQPQPAHVLLATYRTTSSRGRCSDSDPRLARVSALSSRAAVVPSLVDSTAARSVLRSSSAISN